MRNYLLFFILIFSLHSFSQTLSRISPAKNFVTSDTVITFQWNKDSVSAINYELRIFTDSLCNNVFISQSNLIAPFSIITGLNNCTDYYWVYRSNRGSSYSNWSDTNRLSIFTPLCIDSLSLWLDPKKGITKDALNRISSWVDQGPNHYNFVQSTNINKPVHILNSYLYFDGINPDLICLSPIQFKSGFGMFQWLGANTFPALNSVFCQKTSTTNPRIIFCGEQGVSNLWNTAPFNAFAGNLFVNGILGANMLPMNKLKVVNGFSNTMVNFVDMEIGRLHTANNRIWNGNIYDLILLKKIPTEKETFLINNYLYNKVSKPLSLGEDINLNYLFCDTVLKCNQSYSSYLWSTGSSDSAIFINTEGIYWVKVGDVFGRTQIDTIIVYDTRTKLNFKDTTVCYSYNSLIPTKFDSRYTFLWSNGSTNDSLITDQPGDYWVKVSDSLGCYIMDTVHIYVDSFEVDAGLGADKNICSGDKIGLETGNNKATQYLWNDMSTDSLLTIHTAGTYSLTVTDYNTCLARDTVDVIFHGMTPEVGFITDSVCFTHAMNFQDTSYSVDASSIISWEWDFGDGSSPITLPNNLLVSHVYNDTGNYLIKLKVSTDSACSNYIYKNSFVKALPKPFFNPTQACLNEEIQFIDLSTSDFGQNTGFYWDFKDGTNSNLQYPVHTFPQSGTYAVKLIATSEYNCIDSIERNILIKQPPQANFTNNTICFGQTTAFADHSTSVLTHPIYSRMWYFSPYDSATILNPDYTFNSAGSFPVSLIVRSLNGCSDTIQKQVYVATNPVADFVVPNICLYADQTILDNSNISADTILNYIWSIDGVPYSTTKNIHTVFYDTNYHSAKLWISSNYGCTDTISKSFKVNPIPTADFVFDKEYGLPPLDVQFTNQSINGQTYYWDFGDGSSSVQTDPIHTYIDSTIVEPKLFVTNDRNCIDSAKSMIYVVYVKTDVKMESVNAVLEGNYVSFTCTVRNTGKQKLKKIDFIAQYQGALPIMEKWEGILLPDETLTFSFHSKIYIQSVENLKFYCIKAEVSGDQTDENPSNDEICKEYKYDYWLSSVYPIPATDFLNAEIILDNAGLCTIIVSDAMGKEVFTKNYNFNKGLNQFKIPLETLVSGRYTLKIRLGDKEEIREFVK